MIIWYDLINKIGHNVAAFTSKEPNGNMEIWSIPLKASLSNTTGAIL